MFAHDRITVAMKMEKEGNLFGASTYYWNAFTIFPDTVYASTARAGYDRVEELREAQNRASSKNRRHQRFNK